MAFALPRSCRTRRLAAALAAAMLAAPAGAQIVQATASVALSLTPRCQFDSTAPLDFSGVTYQAFSTVAVVATRSVTVSCTRGAPVPKLGWDAQAPGTTATTFGVVSGLRYQLSASSPTMSAGSAPVATASGISSLGTPSQGTVSVTLTVAAGQAGSSTASSAVRTLVVQY